MNFFKKICLGSLGLALPLTGESLIGNGAMTDISHSTKIPEGWSASSLNDVSYDQSVYKSKPGALSVSGKGSWATYRIGPCAGQTLRLRGWIKTEGVVDCHLAIHSFASNRLDKHWQGFHDPSDNKGWRLFDTTVKVVEGFAYAELIMITKGEGRAWLDDLRVESIEGGLPMANYKTSFSQSDTSDLGDRFDSGGDDVLWKEKECELSWKRLWLRLHEKHKNDSSKDEYDVLFFGGTLMKGWSRSGRSAWDRHISPMKAVNYGVAGDTSSQLLWRINHGELDGMSPKVIVLMMGSEQFRPGSPWVANEDIVKGIAAVVSQLRESFPASKILLCELPPLYGPEEAMRIQEMNGQLKELRDGNQVEVLGIGSKFLNPSGSLKNILYSREKNELSNLGYSTWATSMTSLLSEMRHR